MTQIYPTVETLTMFAYMESMKGHYKSVKDLLSAYATSKLTIGGTNSLGLMVPVALKYLKRYGFIRLAQSPYSENLNRLLSKLLEDKNLNWVNIEGKILSIGNYPKFQSIVREFKYKNLLTAREFIDIQYSNNVNNYEIVPEDLSLNIQQVKSFHSVYNIEFTDARTKLAFLCIVKKVFDMLRLQDCNMLKEEFILTVIDRALSTVDNNSNDDIICGMHIF